MSATTKQYLISLWHTFASGFILGVTPIIQTFSFNDLGKDTLKAFAVGLLLAGIRAGWKALAPVLWTAFTKVFTATVNKFWK